MKLISLDAVEKIFEKHRITWTLLWEIQDIQTIDPVEIIEEMIEDIRENPEFQWQNWLDARWATAICYLKIVWEKFNHQSISENQVIDNYNWRLVTPSWVIN